MNEKFTIRKANKNDMLSIHFYNKIGAMQEQGRKYFFYICK